MASETSSAGTRGALAATVAFLFWGLVPLYWKQMQSVPASELIAHRIVWSLLFLCGVMALQRSLASLWSAFRNPKAMWISSLSGLVLAGNWIIYVWAVNSGHVIESSLGYFLTPLGNVAMGYLLLHERLRPLQWAAIAFAVFGVGVLLVGAGHVPWIALTIAATWSVYGILKKKSPLGSMTSLAMETLILFPVAAGFLFWRGIMGEGVLGQVSVQLHVLILSMGVVTSIPLVLFAYGAKRLRLATLGLLQYLSPTVQFLIGLYVYHEPFDSIRFQACMLIWCGLIIYTLDSFWTQRRMLWPSATPDRTP